MAAWDDRQPVRRDAFESFAEFGSKVAEAIEKLNALDDRRLQEIAELRDDVRALSNRIEAVARGQA